MAVRWRGWMVAGIASGALLLPRVGATTDCADLAFERLVLEPVSLEVDGVPDSGWPEVAAGYRIQATTGTGPGGPYYFSSVANTAPGYEPYKEAFHATAPAAP